MRGGPTGRIGIGAAGPRYDAFLLNDAAGLRRHEFATGKATVLLAAEPFEDVQPLFAVSADGTRCVLGGRDTYVVREIATGKTVRVFKRTGTSWLGSRPGLTSVAMSADGKVIAFHFEERDVPGKDAKFGIEVWDVEKDERLARVHVLQNQWPVPVLSPDGRKLATHGYHNHSRPLEPDAVEPEKVVQVWEVAGGKQIAALNDPDRGYGVVAATAFSRDGKHIATSCGQGAIFVWDAATGRLTDTLLGRTFQGQRIAFAPDGKTLAAVDSHGAVERWSLPDGRALKATDFPIPSLSDGTPRGGRSSFWSTGLAFADNERLVAWGAVGNQSVAWEAPGGKLLTAIGENVTEVQSVRFAAGGREVVTAGGDHRIVRWDATTGKAIGPVPLRTEYNLAFSGPDPTYLGPNGHRAIRCWLVHDLDAGTDLFRLPITVAAPSDDFTHAAGFRGPRDYRKPGMTVCEVWNLDTRRRVASLEVSRSVDFTFRGGNAAAFSPDNSRLVTAVRLREPDLPGGPLLVTGWEVKTGKRLGEFREEKGGVVEVAAAANNSGAVLATEDGKLWVADYEKGVRADTIDQAPRPGERIVRPTFSPDGNVLAAGVATEKTGEYAVRVYDWPRGKVLHTFTGHRGPVTALAFSPDGKTLASGSADTTVLLWNLTALTAPK